MTLLDYVVIDCMCYLDLSVFQRVACWSFAVRVSSPAVRAGPFRSVPCWESARVGYGRSMLTPLRPVPRFCVPCRVTIARVSGPVRVCSIAAGRHATVDEG